MPFKFGIAFGYVHLIRFRIVLGNSTIVSIPMENNTKSYENRLVYRRSLWLYFLKTIKKRVRTTGCPQKTKNNWNNVLLEFECLSIWCLTRHKSSQHKYILYIKKLFKKLGLNSQEQKIVRFTKIYI
jgi:hypothetical protein